MNNPVSIKIKKQLKSLEKELKQVIDGSSSPVKNAYLETLDAGGKRLRPVLVFLCSQSNGPNQKNITKAALAVEVIHAASLIHDDIMDAALLRRGRPTVYSKWGNQVAFRTGDYLFARAFLLLSETGNFKAVNILAEAVKKLSEGEIEQVKSAYNANQNRSYYVRKIGLKTAALFRASAQLGALFGGADRQTIKALGDFAQNLGVAFQIFDDILDVCADEEKLGKSLGTDLKDGTLTLPILTAIKESKSQRLVDIFTKENCPDEEIKEGLRIIASTKAVEKSKEEARKFADKAVALLEPVKDAKLKKELVAICDYTIERYS